MKYVTIGTLVHLVLNLRHLIARRTFSARPALPNIPTTPPRDFLHAASGRADAISSAPSCAAEPHTHTTPGLGSNGKEQQERDGLSPSRRYQSAELGWTFAGSGRNASAPRVVKPGATVTFAECSGKTGYVPAEDNRQVPSPTNFPARPTSTPCGAGLRGAASGADLDAHRLANFNPHNAFPKGRWTTTKTK